MEFSDKPTAVMQSHSNAKRAVIILTPIIFCVHLFLTASGSGAIDIGIYKNNTGDISDFYHLEITPASWTFSIWGVIWCWQFLWLAYTLSTLCRTSDSGPLYMHPAQMPLVVYPVYWLNNVVVVSWMVTWDRMIIAAALVFLALTAMTLNVCMYFAYKACDNGQVSLIKQGLAREVWMIRLFIHNGFLVYAAWAEIATLLNMAVVLTYSIGVDQAISCTVALAILAAVFVAWFIFDIFIMERTTRYSFTYYLVLIVALSGSIDKNWDPTKTNSIFTAVLLALVCAAAVIKFVMMAYRHVTRPIGLEKDALVSSAEEIPTVAKTSLP